MSTRVLNERCSKPFGLSLSLLVAEQIAILAIWYPWRATGEQLKMAKHLCRAGSFEYSSDDTPVVAEARRHLQAWLSAVFQTEHMALLIGSGLTAAVAHAAGVPVAGMERITLGSEYDDIVDAHAKSTAQRLGRGDANLEDQIRSANQLIDGLRLLDPDKGNKLNDRLETALHDLVSNLLTNERAIRAKIQSGTPEGIGAKALLSSFLMSFIARPVSNERLSIFTTNYDRLLEYGCDLVGLRLLDRFVGILTPVFRASRLDIDLHYNPPGIRGEPRFLEGVARFTKLHGSLDWSNEKGVIRRNAIPFGAGSDHPDLPSRSDQMIIYPNSSKDVETSQYPYAELFRDCSAALCRPNTAVVTYGYGFGDDHINRVLKDMLALPSTHLVIISFDDASGRIPRFCSDAGRSSQISLLLGAHFGDLGTLTKHYFPNSGYRVPDSGPTANGSEPSPASSP